MKGVFSALVKESRVNKRSEATLDESVGHFISRRFHPDIANNIASAVFHGIYAGDLFQLSARSILPYLWAMEDKHDSIIDSMGSKFFKKEGWQFCDDMSLQLALQDGPWEPQIEANRLNSSVFYLEKGMSQLVEALEKDLAGKKNVRILKSTKVTSARLDDKNLKLSYQSTDPRRPEKPGETKNLRVSHLIAATSMASLLPDAEHAANDKFKDLRESLCQTQAVTVGVVNLLYRDNDLLKTTSPPNGVPAGLPGGLSGFGYLIPNSVPLDQNPEFALGVIFDSDVTPDHWTSRAASEVGTRLTVMLGGHYWDGWSEYPDKDELVHMAMNVLFRHLGISTPPVATDGEVWQQCIPQYTVGHNERMAKGHGELLKHFHGRLRVAGSWYSGVGINDCIRSAHDVCSGLSPGVHPTQRRSTERTGLENFAWGRPMALMRKQGGHTSVVGMDEMGVEQGWLTKVPKPESSRQSP